MCERNFQITFQVKAKIKFLTQLSQTGIDRLLCSHFTFQIKDQVKFFGNVLRNSEKSYLLLSESIFIFCFVLFRQSK